MSWDEVGEVFDGCEVFVFGWIWDGSDCQYFLLFVNFFFARLGLTVLVGNCQVDVVGFVL